VTHLEPTRAGTRFARGFVMRRNQRTARRGRVAPETGARCVAGGRDLLFPAVGSTPTNAAPPRGFFLPHTRFIEPNVRARIGQLR